MCILCAVSECVEVEISETNPKTYSSGGTFHQRFIIKALPATREGNSYAILANPVLTATGLVLPASIQRRKACYS